MKTKIMHLIGSLKMGGAETLITEYALNINQDNFELIIVTLDSKNNTINEKKLKNHGVRVIYLGEEFMFPNHLGFLQKSMNKIQRYFLVYKLLKKEKFDIIHTHLHVNDNILPFMIKNKKTKLFYTVHAEVKELFGKNKAFNRLLMKYLIKHRNMIPIALHSRMKEEMNNLFKIENCKLIPNAINLERFQVDNYVKEDTLESLGLDEGVFILGHIGRFAEVKNHVFLIKLFELIKARIPNSHLLLIGTGILETQIKELVNRKKIKESVSFLGTRGDIPELLSVMDVFLLPSFHEGFGNVLIEAQAVGVKCVVSDTIPSETRLTNLVDVLSLNNSLDTWFKTIISKKERNKNKKELEKHDINNIITKLEKLYIN